MAFSGICNSTTKKMHGNGEYCTSELFWIKPKNLPFIVFIQYTHIVGFKSFSILIMTSLIYLNQFSVPLPWARSCTRVKSCSLTSSRLCFCRALWITWAVLSWLVNCTRDRKKNTQASWERTEFTPVSAKYLQNSLRNKRTAVFHNL